MGELVRCCLLAISIRGYKKVKRRYKGGKKLVKLV